MGKSALPGRDVWPPSSTNWMSRSWWLAVQQPSAKNGRLEISYPCSRESSGRDSPTRPFATRPSSTEKRSMFPGRITKPSRRPALHCPPKPPLDQPQPNGRRSHRAGLLRDHLLVAARRARRRDHRHAALAALRWRLVDAGIDRRWLQSTPLLRQLVAEGLTASSAVFRI